MSGRRRVAKPSNKARFVLPIPESERIKKGATHRSYKWLSTKGVHALLKKPEKHGLNYCTKTQLQRHKPRNGDVFLFDKSKIPGWRKDSVKYIRRRTSDPGGGGVIENHRELKIKKLVGISWV